MDAHHCSDPAKFISVLLTSLSTMIHIELPHVNVLSKIDLVEQYGKLGSKFLPFMSLWLYSLQYAITSQSAKSQHQGDLQQCYHDFISNAGRFSHSRVNIWDNVNVTLIQLTV